MTYVFTFGADHQHPITRESLMGRYVEIPGDIEQSRAVMLLLFGRNWASQYANRERAQVERYRLTPIDWPHVLELTDTDDSGCAYYAFRGAPYTRDGGIDVQLIDGVMTARFDWED